MSAQNAEFAQPFEAASGPRRRPLRRLRRVLIGVVLAILSVAGGYAAYCGVLIDAGNIHAVQPGVVYRSAQLDPAGLAGVVRRYGIKSVLNLRGAHAGQRWYDGEIAAAQALGVAHYDYAMSARRVVTTAQITRLLDIVRRAPKPLLVHCESGADRSGLVAALYEYAIVGASAAEADRQLSLAYGHFPYLTSRTGAMDASFWGFVAAKPEPR